MKKFYWDELREVVWLVMAMSGLSLLSISAAGALMLLLEAGR